MMTDYENENFAKLYERSCQMNNADNPCSQRYAVKTPAVTAIFQKCTVNSHYRMLLHIYVLIC